MLDRISPLTSLQQALASGLITPKEVATDASARANSSASHNTYLHFDREALLKQSESLEDGPLFGIPISLKDCFDLAGTVTTCGSRFYAEHNPVATHDSAMAHVLRASGALITGKTHLHPLAYGITGQNSEYGDSLQPRDAALLTGGSSSGAAASIQEGSALAAIGTDTGGSIRVPAALCGLTGYRSSHALAYANGPWPASPAGLWAGAAHLAPTFDTPGFLLRDPRDAAPIAHALFGLPLAAPVPESPRIAFVDDAFLSDATPDVLTGYQAWRQFLKPAASFHPTWWADSREIFAGIQATEAAAIHRGHFDEFESTIVQRLYWGASISPDELAQLRQRLRTFRSQMADLFVNADFLMLPCAPVNCLVAREDQSNTRASILRYTTPISLVGLPVVALPGEIIGAPFGTGIQLVAAAGEDASLLAFAASIAQRIATGSGAPFIAQ